MSFGDPADESDSDDNDATWSGFQELLQMAAVIRNSEGLMADDLEGTPEHLLESIGHKSSQLSPDVQGALFKRLLKSLTGAEVTETESTAHWGKVLARRNELAEKLGRAVSLRTAAVDYFGGLQLLRNPILLEYEELRRLRHNAATDPLTNLNNRRMFEEYMAREINRSRRYGSSFALLFLDLRNFKTVNDTCGHAVGDEILRSVARASVEAIRGSDVACRIGGDEFAILLPGAERSSAEALAERMARRFEAYANSIAPNCPVEIDYGIAIFPKDGEDATSLFRSADRDLYGNKQRATRRVEGSALSPRASGSEVEQLVPEVGNAPNTGGPDRSGISVSSPDLGRAGEETQLADHVPERRRYKRIPVEGARRLGLVRLQEKSKAVKVLDLGIGGVCLLTDDYDLPDSFPARIQASFLSDAELTLHRIYSRQLPDGKKRVGCSFTPTSDPRTA